MKNCRTFWRGFLCLLVFLSAGSLTAAPDYAPDQVIVRFDKPTSLETAKQTLDSKVFTVDRVLVRKLDIFLVKINSMTVSQALDELKSHPAVRYAQADHYLKQRQTFPDDPEFNTLWNLHNTSNDADVDGPEAWDVTTGGTDPGGNDIVVAVVDGGGLISHSDFSGNLWINPNETSGNGIDDDENGYVDDIYGWDAYSEDGSIPVSGHGTHVAGIVGARGNNGSMVVGVNWQVKLMFVAASTSQTSIALIGYGYVLDQKTLWYETSGARGANVVATNSSFGVDGADCEDGDYPLWNDIYDSMGEVGILSAAATANANWNIDVVGDVPTGCASPFIIAVTNTTNQDVRNSGAAYGLETIDLGAPGTDVNSTYSNGSTTELTGTSMASPHVAGAVALMHAAASQDFYDYYTLYPDSGALAIKQMILDNVDPLDNLDGITVSGGRLNLFNAVTEISTFVGPNPEEPLLVYNSHLIDDAALGDSDGILDPNETADLIVTISNLGADAIGVAGSLATTDPYLTIVDSEAAFPDVLNDSTRDNAADPFVVLCLSDAPPEYSAEVELTLTVAGTYQVVWTFDINLGEKIVYWSDDVEGGENGWTHSNVLPDFTDQWHISTEMNHSPGHAWKCGDSGTGDYDNLLDAGLVSPEIEITPYSSLFFWHWISSEISGTYPDSAYDGGIIEISADEGPFEQVAPTDGYPKFFRETSGGGNPFTGPMPGQPCFAGSMDWSEFEIDLSAYADQTIQIRFRFGTDVGTTFEGWYVDDIQIRGTAPQGPTPDPITDLTIQREGDDIHLWWSEPTSGADSYTIYSSSDQSDLEGSSIAPEFQIDTTTELEYLHLGAITAVDSLVFYAVTAVFE